jgi:hypothetical protein
MNTFKEVPASKLSINQRKMVFSVGINDADYMTSQRINKKEIRCPFYTRWRNMLKRCYCLKSIEKRSTYSDCTVHKDWHLFSNFKAWMVKQDWQGKQLDKDILHQGNKLYSADNCIFVSEEINSLFLTVKSSRGKYKLGTSLCKRRNKFEVSCRDYQGNRLRLGYHVSEHEAHEVYKKYKYKLISDIASQQTEPLKSAMLNHVILEY